MKSKSKVCAIVQCRIFPSQAHQNGRAYRPTKSYTSSVHHLRFLRHCPSPSCVFLQLCYPSSCFFPAHLMVLCLRPITDKLEPANDLTDREEANHLGRDHTCREPLCAGHVSYASNNVGGVLLHLLCSRVGLTGRTVEQRSRVLQGVESWLEVALECLERTGWVSAMYLGEMATVPNPKVGVGQNLRWCHVSLVGDELP